MALRSSSGASSRAASSVSAFRSRLSLTIAETGYSPRYPTLVGRRRASAATIERLTGQILGLDASTVGLRVADAGGAHETGPLPERSCQFVAADGLTYDELASALVELGTLGAVVDHAP